MGSGSPWQNARGAAGFILPGGPTGIVEFRLKPPISRWFRRSRRRGWRSALSLTIRHSVAFRASFIALLQSRCLQWAGPSHGRPARLSWRHSSIRSQVLRSSSCRTAGSVSMKYGTRAASTSQPCGTTRRIWPRSRCFPLAILCLVLALQRRSRIWSLGAAAVVALLAATSAFGPVDNVIAAICLVSVLPRESWRTNALRIAGIGAFGYLMAVGMVPPSVWVAIQDSAHYSPEERWSLGSVTAVAVVLVGWTVLHHVLKRSTKDWRVHFLVLFAWLMSSIPFTWDILGRRFMPQPNRYKLELELALALPIALGIRWLMQKLPASVRRAAILLMLALAAEQIVSFRKLEKAYLAPQDVTTTVEYRAASWVEHNLPGQRVLFPGSVAQWANAFAGTLQFSGGPWSQATNRSQQFAQADILFAAGPKISEISLIWLKAYGVSAVGVSAPDSKEFWKPYADPSKFDALPVLWSDQGVTIRKVPLRTASLSHVVADDAIVPRPPRNPEDVGDVRKYVAALDDPSLPVATLDWKDNNHIRIETTAAPGQVISVQVGYHPGWHATVNGERREICKDGLGLMWLRPDCHGACEINLAYGGGLELWVSRIVSYGAIAALVVMFGVAILRRLRRGSAVYSTSQTTIP